LIAPVIIGAPAKINLYLHVLGRRTDGYHDLDSLVAFATLHDVITASPSDDLTLALEGGFAADLSNSVGGPDNLVLRAARLLAEHIGQDATAAIRLHKMIPVAAGLGGGSTDGAATLLALCRLWHVEVPFSVLTELALRLGADLPVCLASRTAFMSGVGETLTPAPEVPPLGVVLVNPRVALPTADVFRALDGRFAPASRPSYKPGDPVSLIDALRKTRNDLTEPAIRLAPVVREVLTALEAAPGVSLARMSGSGATCFGLFADSVAAQIAAEEIAGAQPMWWVRACRLIRGREELIEG
jgi:4-diphosphocytidyl-2-C-methyl-D-erythritol kinase